MRRFFVIALAISLAACMGDNTWSQSGGGGGGASGGASGGAGGAGGAGAAGGAGGAGAGATGTAGTTGTAGGAGAAGTAGTAGGAGAASPAGTAGTAGTAAGNRGVGANAQAGAQGRMNNQFGVGPTPFFADPGARQQLGLNNNQFNQLNQAYQQALQRYNTGAVQQNGSAAGANTRTGTNATGRSNLSIDGNTGDGNRNDLNNDGRSNAAERRAERLQDFQNRRNYNGTAGTNNAARQRAQQLDRFENRFDLDNDFNGVVDQTFTDPAMRQRFNQLNWQYQGPAAFNNPQIQQQLNLTAQQRQQLRSLAGEWRQQLLNARRNNRTNLTPEQFDALRDRFNQRLSTVLTPEQQQMWAQMIGDPYNFPITAYFPQNNGTNASRVGIGTGVQDTGGTTPGTTRGNDSDNVAIEPYGGRTGTGSSANRGTRNSGDSGTRR